MGRKRHLEAHSEDTAVTVTELQGGSGTCDLDSGTVSTYQRAGLAEGAAEAGAGGARGRASPSARAARGQGAPACRGRGSSRFSVESTESPENNGLLCFLTRGPSSEAGRRARGARAGLPRGPHRGRSLAKPVSGRGFRAPICKHPRVHDAGLARTDGSGRARGRFRRGRGGASRFPLRRGRGRSRECAPSAWAARGSRRPARPPAPVSHSPVRGPPSRPAPRHARLSTAPTRLSPLTPRPRPRPHRPALGAAGTAASGARSSPPGGWDLRS